MNCRTNLYVIGSFACTVCERIVASHRSQVDTGMCRSDWGRVKCKVLWISLHIRVFLFTGLHLNEKCWRSYDMVLTCIGYSILVWPTSWTPAVGGLFVCECVFVCICVYAVMTPYCSAHDEWLIMKRSLD